MFSEFSFYLPNVWADRQPSEAAMVNRMLAGGKINLLDKYFGREPRGLEFVTTAIIIFLTLP